MTGTRGLVGQGRSGVKKNMEKFVRQDMPDGMPLSELVKKVKPTMLIGTSGTSGVSNFLYSTVVTVIASIAVLIVVAVMHLLLLLLLLLLSLFSDLIYTIPGLHRGNCERHGGKL